MNGGDALWDKGLPASIDIERQILGAVMGADSFMPDLAAKLRPEDFHLHKHRVVFARMLDLYEAGTPIDRVSVYDALTKTDQVESVDGLAGLLALDEDLPEMRSIDHWVDIVREKSTLRKLIFTAQKVIDKSLVAQETSGDIIAAAGKNLATITESATDGNLRSVEEVIKAYPGGIGGFLDPTTRDMGIKTGFTRLDRMTGGFRAGELIIVAARPSMGKTAFAMDIATHICLGDKPEPVAVFSLEMPWASLLQRAVTARAKVNSYRFRNGWAGPAEREQLQVALYDLTRSALFIDDTPSLSIQEMHAKLRRMKQRHGLALVIIDYLQLVASRGRYENRNQELSVISRGCKLMAKDLGVPVVALSQLARDAEKGTGHVPQLSHLRDSGSLEQDADMVMFIVREEVYHPDRDDLKGAADIHLSKQRNGPIGKISLRFLKEYTSFVNKSEDLPDESPQDTMFE